MPQGSTPQKKPSARGPNRVTLLALAASAGLAAALLAYVVVARQTPGAGLAPPVAVVVAACDLPPRRVLTADMLAVRLLPPVEVPEGAVGTPAGLVGEVTTQEVVAGQPVSRAAVTARDSLPGLALAIAPQHRAVSVPLDPVSGDPGFLEPGDHVDVLATFTTGNEESVTLTILQDARLLAIGTRTESTPAGADAPDRPATSATVEVTPRAAQALALAAARGRLQLTLRGLGDDVQPSVPMLVSSAVIGSAPPAPNSGGEGRPPAPSSEAAAPSGSVREGPSPVKAMPPAVFRAMPKTSAVPMASQITVIRGTEATNVTVGE